MMPPDFVWGAATSAQQIEGAAREGGRGESVWDRFAAMPGRIKDSSGPEPGADHYNRVREDVALMRELGIQAYRFSVAWPRVQPRGGGPANRAGLDFYDRMVDLLLESNIRPFATLYHDDLPQAVQERGGWANRDTVERFAEYADMVAYRLGDRVHDWITLDEPYTVARYGYATGERAPGLANPALYTRVAHHLLLAHGMAVPVLRGQTRGGAARVGIALGLSPIYPASDHDEDERAAIMRDGALNRWYLDALYKGAYPADMSERQPIEYETGDMEIIAAPLDFLGVNYFRREVVTMGPGDEPREAPRGADLTTMGWEVYPEGLYDLLTRLTRDYAPPALYVAGNGAAYADTPGPDGAIHDARRVAYLEAHIAQVARALAAGVPLGGYFVWSLLDNWEWREGYTQRFGLIYVDSRTQSRTIKESGRWFARLIAGEGVTL